MGTCAGVDWARDEHAVLVADERGEPLEERTLAHHEEGITALCGLLCGHGVERVAVERPDGLLVERLLDAGLCVLALHPNQIKAARARFRAQGGKSDRFDAFVLCQLARTDWHRFRALVPDADATKALRAPTRARQDPVEARVAPANRPRAELERFWPGATGLFADIDSENARAHDHQRAIRTVGRAWTRVPWRTWQNGTAYDPARHNALQRQLTATG